jgi:putative membrane protein
MTGLPFGAYRYTNAWWPTIRLGDAGPFPLQLPFAWLLIVGASFLALRPFTGRWTWVVAALLAAAIDLAMEPVMTGPLGYWRWSEIGPLPGGAPLANTAGWAAVAMIAGIALETLLPPDRRKSLAPALVLAGHVVLCVGLGVESLVFPSR